VYQERIKLGCGPAAIDRECGGVNLGIERENTPDGAVTFN
jgi:hypothetical protein